MGSTGNNSSDWNEERAGQLALLEGIRELEANHWRVIYYLRDYYGDFKKAPTLRKISAHTRLTSLEIYRLFPRGGLSSAWRIAGLPPLQGCS
ncbi:MAG: DsrC [Peptococcaceae bacterium]|jgi:tRNA 2-thiouridine synthesizing protein E|nr:DsrC [Peptococcaceae bacterium]